MSFHDVETSSPVLGNIGLGSGFELDARGGRYSALLRLIRRAVFELEDVATQEGVNAAVLLLAAEREDHGWGVGGMIDNSGLRVDQESAMKQLAIMAYTSSAEFCAKQHGWRTHRGFPIDLDR